MSPMTDNLIGPPILDDQAIVGDRIGRYAPRARMDGWRTALGDASSNEGSPLPSLRSDGERRSKSQALDAKYVLMDDPPTDNRNRCLPLRTA